jgi:hypothetical protein
MTTFLTLAIILVCSSSSAHAQEIWKQVYSNPVKLYYAATADSVYVVDGFDLLLTTDACATWNKIGAIPSLKDTVIGDERVNYVFEDMIFASSQVALMSIYSYRSSLDGTPLTDPVGKLYLTRDGGINWDTSNYSFNDNNGPTTPIEKFQRMSQGIIFGFGGSRSSLVETGTLLGHTCAIFDGDTIKKYPVPAGISPASAAAVLGEDMIFIGNGKAMLGTYLDSKFRTYEGIQPPVVYVKKGWIETSQHRSRDNGSTWDSLFTTVTELYGSDFGVGWGKVGRWMKINRFEGWARVQGNPSLYKIKSFDTSVAYALTARNGYLQRTISGGFAAAVGNRGNIDGVVHPNPASDHINASHPVLWSDLLGRRYSPPFEVIGDRYQYDVRGLNAGTYIVRHGNGSQLVIVQH